jgi:hypothetical protein
VDSVVFAKSTISANGDDNFGVTSANRNSIGGSIEVQAKAMTLIDTALQSSASIGGNIGLTAPSITLRGSSINVGGKGSEALRGGNITFAVNDLTVGVLANKQSIVSTSSESSTPGTIAGDITVQGLQEGSLPEFVKITGSMIESEARLLGSAGTINLAGKEMTLDNSTISTTVRSGSNGASSIGITAQNLNLLDGATIKADTRGGARAGNINLNVGNFTASNRAVISSRSTNISSNAGNAGRITIQGIQGTGSSASSMSLTGSEVTTSALQASGGDITLKANDIIRLNGAKVTAQVQGGPETKGGNIVIDPQYVIIQGGSVISASASQGGGGTINIQASQAILQEPGTQITATGGAPGLDGSVSIRAPFQQLGGAIAPLPQAFAVPTNLYGQRCAAQKGGQFSSFVHGSRDGLPPQPGDLIASPLALNSELFIPSTSSQPTQDLATVQTEVAESNHSNISFATFSACRS